MHAGAERSSAGSLAGKCESRAVGSSGRESIHRNIRRSNGRFTLVNHGSSALVGRTKIVYSPANRPANTSANS